MAIFQSFGYIPVRTDFENIEVREGVTILAAIFNNLLGIMSRPVAWSYTKARREKFILIFTDRELSEHVTVM